MAGITLEQLEQIRRANKLTGWSTTNNNQLGAQDEGLNQQNRGQAGSLDSVIAANNTYLQSGNIGNDIQYYYDNYGNNADIYDFINQYNNNIDTLNKSWETNPLHYNSTGWKNHNQLYKKMYNSRSITGGDIGYSSKLEDLLGSSTWLRNADHYDKSWYALDDAQKAERTHTITIGGKQYKVGKDQFGHLVKIDDPESVQDSNHTVTSNENTKEVISNPYDITTPKEPIKPKFQWHDWVPLGMQMFNNLAATSTIYNNNSLQKTPLLQGYRKVHKDTSNYQERSMLENNQRQMMQTLSKALANTNDPDRRQFILGKMQELSQNTTQQAALFNQASQTNAQGATEVANFNNYNENNVANTNMQNNVTAYNNLIQNRNELATKKAYYLNDWIGKTNDSYKEAVKGYRQNLQNIDIETAKYNNLINQTNLYNQYNADLYNVNYNKDNILSALRHIQKDRIAGENSPTVRDEYYQDLDQQDMLQLTQTINRLSSGEQLTMEDKELIDKIIAIDNPYNQKQFAHLDAVKRQLKEDYDWHKQLLNFDLSNYMKQQSILLPDQGFIPGRYKKGGKVDTSIINNAFKTFQKEQDSARKNSVENAKQRLSKLEKELDRIHEKQIFLLKQIYK